MSTLRQLRPSAVLALLLSMALTPRGHAASGTVVAAGYALPSAATAAPGQLITILVQGITAPQQSVYAGSGQWPATLAGISAALVAWTVPGSTAGIKTLSVPIGAVFPFLNCEQTKGQSCETLTALTLQIPFDMLGPPPSQRSTPPLVSVAVLTVSDAEGNAATIGVNPISDQIHLVRSFDTLAGGFGGGIPAVTHADGSAVSAASPAKQMEALTMYAVGLGVTSPPVTSGMLSPASPLAYAQQNFALHYDFEANASPSPGVQGASVPPGTPPAPLFVGLAPGFVGLYQINFLAFVPSGTPSCGSALASNVTVTLVGAASFDGSGICVDVSTPRVPIMGSAYLPRLTGGQVKPSLSHNSAADPR